MTSRLASGVCAVDSGSESRPRRTAAGCEARRRRRPEDELQTNRCVGVVMAGCLGALLTAPSLAYADEPPPAARGFQMALRTGYSIPMGKATGVAGDDLNKTFFGQVPILVDLGGKLGDNVFLRGYLGLGIGGAGSTVGASCST